MKTKPEVVTDPDPGPASPTPAEWSIVSGDCTVSVSNGTDHDEVLILSECEMNAWEEWAADHPACALGEPWPS